MERLALLKTNAPGTTGPQCPPEQVWLELAAGIVTQDAESRLSHAANCDQCGLLLRQAVADLAAELTPQEEAQISNLSSSTSAWRSSMAASLQDAQEDLRIAHTPIGRRPSAFAALFSPFRLAFAAAIIGLIALGIRDYLRSARVSGQPVATTAGASSFEEEVRRQKAQIAELTAQLSRSGTAGSASGPHQIDELGAVSLSLDSGLTRGNGAMKRIAIPAEAEVVRIAVHISSFPEGVLHEELLTIDRRPKWSQELRPSDAEKRSGSLTLLLPAYLLTPDDYLIVLSRELPSGHEEMATYVFRVTR